MTDDLDRELERLKHMGITISTHSHPGASFEPQGPMSIIAQRAKAHGMYYKDGEA